MAKFAIDDVRLPKKRSQSGNPIIFKNPEIRLMLKLAKASKKDIFVDLGCGYGQNLIVAVTEFNVRHAYGIEDLKRRAYVAKARIQNARLQGKIDIIKGSLDDLLDDKLNEINMQNATIVFYGLEGNATLTKKFCKKLPTNCKLLYYYNCLIPEIKPNNVKFPFYLSRKPFKHPKSELDWLLSVISKKQRLIPKSEKLAVRDLWAELYHDYEVDGIRNDINKFKKRLENFLSNKS